MFRSDLQQSRRPIPGKHQKSLWRKKNFTKKIWHLATKNLKTLPRTTELQPTWVGINDKYQAKELPNIFYQATKSFALFTWQRIQILWSPMALALFQCGASGDLSAAEICWAPDQTHRHRVWCRYSGRVWIVSQTLGIETSQSRGVNQQNRDIHTSTHTHTQIYVYIYIYTNTHTYDFMCM